MCSLQHVNTFVSRCDCIHVLCECVRISVYESIHVPITHYKYPASEQYYQVSCNEYSVKV